VNVPFKIALIGVVVLDAVIVASTIFGGGQRSLVHGLGPAVLPLYAMVAIAWLWVLAKLADAMKKPGPIAWRRLLVIAVLASVPMLL